MLDIFSYYIPPTPEIYTLSLHDALPILLLARPRRAVPYGNRELDAPRIARAGRRGRSAARSEEHTSELQSHHDLVCRLLLEKKKIITPNIYMLTLTISTVSQYLHIYPDA